MAAAGSCVAKLDRMKDGIKVYRFAWLSDGAGVVSGLGSLLTGILGTILGVTFAHDATDIPTTNYDVYLKTATGSDVLIGAGVDVPVAGTPPVTVRRTPVTSVNGLVALYPEVDLTLEVSGAGAAKMGTVYLAVQEG